MSICIIFLSIGQSYEKKGEGAYKNQRGTLIGLISEVKCCAIAQSGFIIEWYREYTKKDAMFFSRDFLFFYLLIIRWLCFFGVRLLERVFCRKCGNVIVEV